MCEYWPCETNDQCGCACDCRIRFCCLGIRGGGRDCGPGHAPDTLDTSRLLATNGHFWRGELCRVVYCVSRLSPHSLGRQKGARGTATTRLDYKGLRSEGHPLVVAQSAAPSRRSTQLAKLGEVEQANKPLYRAAPSCSRKRSGCSTSSRIPASPPRVSTPGSRRPPAHACPRDLPRLPLLHGRHHPALRMIFTPKVTGAPITTGPCSDAPRRQPDSVLVRKSAATADGRFYTPALRGENRGQIVMYHRMASQAAEKRSSVVT